MRKFGLWFEAIVKDDERASGGPWKARPASAFFAFAVPQSSAAPLTFHLIHEGAAPAGFPEFPGKTPIDTNDDSTDTHARDDRGARVL